MSLALTGSQTSRPAMAKSVISQEAAFALACATAIFATVIWLPFVLQDPDTLWHITTGNWILAHGEVPKVDVFSYTAAGHPWVAHEWLSELILAVAYRASGWIGLLILTAIAAATVIGLLAYYIRRNARADIAALLVLLAVICGAPSLLTRPHLIALPLLTLWTIGMLSARARGTAPSLFLVPLMTLWANLHGGYVVGLVLAGALAVEAVFDPVCVRREAIRSWGLFILGSALAAAATPHGIEGLLFPIHLMSMKNLSQIQEWAPSDFSHLNGVVGAILIALYLGLTGRLQLPKFRVLQIIGLVFVTMQHARNSQLLGIIGSLLLADSLGCSNSPFVLSIRRPLGWTPVWIASAVIIVSLSLRIGKPLERLDDSNYPMAAIANVPADLRVKPVFNEYGFGGLLIFQGIRPFIDGRADLYGDDFLDMYISAAHGRGNMLDEVLCRYNIDWTIFSADSIATALLDRTPGWHRLFSDKTAVIHVRDPDAIRPVCPRVS